MSGDTLNDVVVEWGSHNGANAYNPAKDRLTSGLSQDEVAAFAGATNWNDGLRYLAEGPPVLQEAVLLLDASFSDAGEPRVINRGTGGSVLDAKYGSVLGAYVYDGAAVLPGLSANYLSVPDEAAFRISDNLEVVVRIKSNTVVGNDAIIGRDDVGGISRSWAVLWADNGRFLFYGYDSAGTGGTATSDAHTRVAGETFWLKVTWQNGVGVNFYTADDSVIEPSTWVNVGTVKPTVITNLRATPTTGINLGTRNRGSFDFWDGHIYHAIVRDGIGGTTVLDVDLTDVPDYATPFTAKTGQTVTVNSTSSDTNDPLLLPWYGENYLYSNGNNNRAATSVHLDWSSIATTTVMQFEAKVRILPGKGLDVVGTSNTKVLAMYLEAGLLRVGLSIGGSNYFRTLGNVVTSYSDFIEVRVVHDTTTGISTGYQKLSGVWTLVGSDFLAIGALEPCTGPCYIGSSSFTSAEGCVASASIKLDGVTLVQFDCVNANSDSTSFVSSGGHAFTVQRHTSGRKTALVTRPIWMFGTDDYFMVPDNDLLDFGASDSFTLMSVSRMWAADANSGGVSILDKGTGSLITGYGMSNNRQIYIGDGAVQPVSPSTLPTAGGLRTSFGIRDVGTDLIYGNNNNVATSNIADLTTGSLSNTEAFFIGADGGTTSWLAVELVAVAVFRRVLAPDEIAAINSYYGTV